MESKQMIQEGSPVELYALRGRYVDLDVKKLELNPVQAKDFETVAQKVFDLEVLPENYWWEYDGITSKDVLIRLSEHMQIKSTEPLSYLKDNPVIIHREKIGKYKAGISEKLERLWLENRNEFYKLMYREFGIFIWPFGPRVEKKGRQKTHPYPDNVNEYPMWFRELRAEEEPKAAAKEAIVEL